MGKQTVLNLNGSEPELSGKRALLRPPLVVMVNDDLCYLYELIFKRYRPYECHFITDGDQALEFCQKTRPDVVISDVYHPGLDGFELRRHFRSNLSLSNIPFIFLTAANPSLFSNLQALRAEYLGLPCSPDQLLEYTDNALRQSRPEYMQQVNFLCE